MPRLMFDSDKPLDLPITGDLLATYADLIGAAELATLRHRWRGVVLIERGLGDPLGLASVIDIEAHAEGVGAARPWLTRKHGAGVHYLTTYCNRATVAAVDAAVHGLPHWRWIATLDGTAHIAGMAPGHHPAAVQCLNAAMLGFHADASVVWADAWNPTTRP